MGTEVKKRSGSCYVAMVFEKALRSFSLKCHRALLGEKV
jgi:hypothetical protein